MKNWLLTLLLILAAASAATFFVAGLENSAQAPAASRMSPLDEPYDYYVQDMHATRFDASGTAVSQLRAERVTHYPDDDRAELQAPRYAALAEDGWRVAATAGTLVPDAERGEERLDLRGAVELRMPLANGDNVEVATSELTLFTQSEEAFSNAEVALQTRNSRLNGVGLQARLAQDIQVNNGNGTHDPATNP